ncbi:LCP family protein [Cellulomonas edaphi]|uniref:LCP family protein n=1 Tax=Cellulomonas edaphi TaxID=3053468 RepID=A0ABT7SAA3_9CELL|nr:LCP family protein [Cellulomons edaphi]MDM7832560.1 LCP family protein [Cellulomons edaphi]
MSTTAPRHSRRPARPRRALRAAALVALAVPLFVVSAAGATYLRLDANIDTADGIDAYLGTSRPSASADPLVDGFAGRPLNILVMGIDARDGDNADFAGHDDGQRSDSTFLVHLPADRSRIDIVSVPRDSLVEIPSCLLEDGTQTPARASDMFNAAFQIGSGPDLNLTTAAACTRRTFEHLTGVRTDEHVVVKMNGVRDIIDTLGGVPFCLPEAMDSPKARFKAPAGHQVFNGRQAIGFLRSRTGTGNGLWLGSDLGRLDRQHQFLVALTDKIHRARLLSKPRTLLTVLNQATKAISVSPGLGDLRTMAGLANGLRGIDGARVNAITVPTESVEGSGRVRWTAAADDIWERINADRPLTDPAPAPTGTHKAPKPSKPNPTGPKPTASAGICG